MPPRRKSSPKKKKASPRRCKRGGSVASDAVTSHVSSGAWRSLDTQQSTYPGLSGGAMTFGKLFKPSKYVLTHQSLSGGSTTTVVPPVQRASGHAPNHWGTIADAMVLNQDASFQHSDSLAHYPAAISSNHVDFQLGGARRRKTTTKKSPKKSSPRRRKKSSPLKLPSLKDLQKDLQKVFGKKPKKYYT